MSEKRSSVFFPAICEIKEEIADITEKEKYTNTKILSYVKSALASLPNITGICSSRKLLYSFLDTDDSLGYDSRLFENVSNITAENKLELTDDASAGYIETVALGTSGFQVALVTVRWNKSGSTNPPTLNISLNKNPTSGETTSAMWLVSESRLDAIQDGVQLDLSDIPSPSFSLKWNFPSGSDYKIFDTTVSIYLVNASQLENHLRSIVLVAAANILGKESMLQAKEGNEDYARFLSEMSKTKYQESRGNIGGNTAGSLGVTSADDNFDRSSRANKAFNSTYKEGDPIEIVNNMVRRA